MWREVPLYCNPKGLLTEQLKAAEMAAVMVAEYYRSHAKLLRAGSPGQGGNGWIPKLFDRRGSGKILIPETKD